MERQGMGAGWVSIPPPPPGFSLDDEPVRPSRPRPRQMRHPPGTVVTSDGPVSPKSKAASRPRPRQLIHPPGTVITPQGDLERLSGNIVPSAKNALTGLWHMVRHPADTMEGLSNAGLGAVQYGLESTVGRGLEPIRGEAPEQAKARAEQHEQAASTVAMFYRDRYGSPARAKETLITDPVGAGLDLAGGAALTRGVVRASARVGATGVDLAGKAALGAKLDGARGAARMVLARDPVVGSPANLRLPASEAIVERVPPQLPSLPEHAIAALPEGFTIDAPVRAAFPRGTAGRAAAMEGDALPSLSQELSRQPQGIRPLGLNEPLGIEQMRQTAQEVAPGDVLPIPSNQVGSVEEAATIDAGRFTPAKAPNERTGLSRGTIRAWSGESIPKVGPLDLVGWLRTRGGIADQGGELTHMGLTNAPRRGMDFVGQEHRFGPLVSNAGMNLDDAALQAWEAGYFPDLAERPTTNQFLDRLRATHEGRDRAFLAADLPEIERFNALRDERHALENQRWETGEEVWQDKSIPADEPQPLPPVQAYEEWPAGGPDFAGNINLGKLASPQDIKRALDFTERRVGFDAATRGRVSQAETERLASELGMTPERLLARRKGEAFNAEEALAARQILAKSGNELVNLARRVRAMDDPGDEALAAFRQAWLRHAAIQEQVAGATAEAGRALQQFRMAADSRAVRKDVLTAMIEGGGGRDRIRDAADALIDAVETDPGKFNPLVEQISKPRFKDKALELWYNMLLSGPATHAVNVTSNTLTALGQLPEHGAAAIIGKAREVFNRGAVDRVTSTEVGRRAYGMLEGLKDGLRQFVRTARTGDTSDHVTKVELQSQRAISGLKGEIIRTPSRFLAAEDELFKAVARRMELHGDAARIAHKEGLRGDAASTRIAELVANPTDEMLARSLDYGRYLTFQRPLGDFASKIAAARSSNPLFTVLVPFVRTPTNLLKFAVERSPAAPLLKEWRADFRAGGARRDLAIARMMVGSAFGAAIYEAAIKGYITGSTPDDSIKAQFMRADGWQPYSFRVGDKWYSYNRLDPFATTIGVAADLATKRDGMTSRQLDNYAMLLTASIMQNMGDKTWLSGISDFVQTLQDSQRYGPSYLRKMGASFVTPTLSSQVARAVDPVLRDTRTLGDTIRSRIPGLSSDLPAKRDIWGEPITSEGGPGPDFMAPVRQSSVQHDPLNREMLEIGARFSDPQRFIIQDGQRVDLTPRQFEQYSALAGQQTRKMIEGLMAQPGWADMPAEARAAAVKKAAMAAKKATRSELFGSGSKEVPPPGFSMANVPPPPSGFTVEGQSGGRNVYAELQEVIPGVIFTSGFRTTEYQADMRKRGYHPADNSGHLSGSSFDLQPPPGKSMGWLKAQVKRYDPSARLLPEGDHLHVTFPGYYGAPPLGGARSAGLANPLAGMPPPPAGFTLDAR